MRKLVLASIAATAICSAPAQAAPPVFNWAGFYLGAYAGYAWGRTVATDKGDLGGSPWYPPLGQQFSNSNDSFIGGVEAGYNFQFGNWVTGLETDVGSMRFKGLFLYGGDSPLTTNSSYDATFRGRLGYAFDRSLLYVTGGAFVADPKRTLPRHTPSDI